MSDPQTWTPVAFEKGDSVDLPEPVGRITFQRSGIYLIGPSGATRLAELPMPTVLDHTDNRRRMNVSLGFVLRLVAVVLFALAAFGVGFGSVAIVPLGLAFFAASFLT